MDYGSVDKKKKSNLEILVPEIKIETGNILNFKADAIVLSASSHMHHPVGTGLDKAVYDKAGRDELIAERERVLREQGIETLKAGDIFVTSGCEMVLKKGIKNIIHVIVPKYSDRYVKDGIDNNIVFLESIIEKIYITSKIHGFKHLSLPLIGTGALGFNKEDVLRIIKDAFLKVRETDTEYFEDFIVEIVQSDEKYNKNNNDLPGIDDLLKMMRKFGIKLPDFKKMDYECLKRWVNDSESTINEIMDLHSRNLDFYDIRKYIIESILQKNQSSTRNKTNSAFENRWVKLLKNYMDRNNLTMADLHERTGIQQSGLSRLLSGQQKKMGRYQVIKLALALELSLEEAEEFICLGSAGLVFPDPNDKREQIFVECLEGNISQKN